MCAVHSRQNRRVPYTYAGPTVWPNAWPLQTASTEAFRRSTADAVILAGAGCGRGPARHASRQTLLLHLQQTALGHALQYTSRVLAGHARPNQHNACRTGCGLSGNTAVWQICERPRLRQSPS